MSKIMHMWLGLFLLISLNVKVWAGVEEDKGVFEELSHRITTSFDPKEVSEAVLNMGRLEYAETSNFLLSVLKSELQKKTPNSYILGNALKSLKSIGDKNILIELNAQQATLENVASQASWGSHVTAEYKACVEFITKKGKEPAKLFANSPTSANQFYEVLTAVENKFVQDAIVLLKGTDTFVSDPLYKEAEANGNKVKKIPFRDTEADSVIDTLVRLKGSNPVLVGEPGVGKTTVVERVVQKIVTGDFPSQPVFEEIRNAYVIQTSAHTISALAKSNDANAQAVAIKEYFESVEGMGKKLNRPIVVFIDEIHMLSKGQINALKTFMDKKNGIKLIGASTSREFALAVKDDAAMERRFKTVVVNQLSEKDTMTLLNDYWKPLFEKRYLVKIEDEAIVSAVKSYLELEPSLPKPEGPIKILQDACISLYRTAQQTLGSKQLYQYITKETGIPIDPNDAKAFSQFLEIKKQEIKAEVVGQDHLVDHFMNQFSSMKLGGSNKRHKVDVIIGGTGTGKSYLAGKISEKIFGDSDKLLRIDGNTLSHGDLDWNVMVGTVPGTVGSDSTVGVLNQFLEGRGKRGGGIVIDEGDKMHESNWKKMMEVFDRGYVDGNDGKRRYLNLIQIIITSNKGDELILPRGKNWTPQEIKAHVLEISADQKQLKEVLIENTNKSSDRNSSGLPASIANRIDHISAAMPIFKDDAILIAELEVNKVKKVYAEKYKTNLTVSPELIQHLAAAGFIPEDGARHITKQVSSVLDQAVVEALKQGSIQGKEIVLGLEFVNKKPLVVVSGEKISAKFDAPFKPFENPLEDPTFRERLKKLETAMNTQVIGQQSMIKSLSEAISGRYFAWHSNPRPLTILLVGRTGVGKTETGKALAESFFGNASRIEVIPMGGIGNEHEFNNFIGSPKGHVGSEDAGLFEAALKKMPMGGVVVLDEISNMGAGDKTKKDVLLKKFYNLIEEGFWISSTGKRYDLKKYIFVFTGNDGQELFEKAIDDVHAMDIWKEMRGKIKTYLRDSGFPEPLLARIDYIDLLKPLVAEERALIADKLLKNIFEGIKKQHHGLRIETSADFYKKFQRAFFSPTEGARSLRKVGEQQIASLLQKAVMLSLEGDYDSTKISKLTVQLSLEDNLPTEPFVTEEFSRAIVLKAQVIDEKKKKLGAAEADISELAPNLMLLNKDRAKVIAIHEAGHAVANDSKLTGMKVHFISIVPSEKSMGVTFYKQLPSQLQSQAGGMDREAVLSNISRALGGSMAERMFDEKVGFNSGWSSDIQNAEKLALAAIKDMRLVPGVNPNDAQQVNRAVWDLMKEAEQLTQETLVKNWPLLMKVADETMVTGGVTAEQYEKLATDFAAKKGAFNFSAKPARSALAELSYYQTRPASIGIDFGNPDTDRVKRKVVEKFGKCAQ